MSEPSRAWESRTLTSTQRRGPVRVSANPPASLLPCATKDRCPGSSLVISAGPSSQMITAPVPRRASGCTPSNSPASRVWSSTGTASRRTAGSSEGPLGTAQERSTGPAWMRRSKCSVVASWSWTTNRDAVTCPTLPVAGDLRFRQPARNLVNVGDHGNLPAPVDVITGKRGEGGRHEPGHRAAVHDRWCPCRGGSVARCGHCDRGGGREPAAAGREPAAAGREPASPQREPANAQREPANAQREPANAQREPANAQREPANTELERTTPADRDRGADLFQGRPHGYPHGRPAAHSDRHRSRLRTIRRRLEIASGEAA